MKNDDHPNRSRHFSLLLAAVFLLVGLAPSVVFAQSPEKLTRYLPSQTEMVVGIDVAKLSKSKYYKQALTWARKSASDADKKVFETLEKEANLDLSKDLHSIAIAIPNTQVGSGTNQRHFTAAISGKFDKKKLLATIKKNNPNFKKTKQGKTTVYTTGDSYFTFPKKSVLWVTAGPDKYRKQAFKALANSKHSVKANKLFKGLMGAVNTSRSFWLLGDTSKMKTQAAGAGPQPNSLAVTMDINNGLNLDLLADMPTKEDAKSAVAQMKSLKQQSAQNPMVSVVGAGPLVSNLATKQDGTKLLASTTMTAAEFDTLIQRVKQLAAAQMQGGGATMPTQPVPSKGGSPSN